MSTKRPINYGIVGVGIWGQIHVRTLIADPQVNLVAVCDLNEELAKSVAARYHIPKYYTSYEEMLKDPEIEAVSVATPDFAHAGPALAVVEAGKHLLVEKPMAMSIDESLQIIRTSREKGVKLMVDLHNRWSPPFFNAYQSLRQGELGELKYIYFRLSDTMFVPLEYISWGSKSSALWFLGPHAIDTVRWLYQDEVEEVYAVARQGVLTSKGIDTPDFFALILQFKNGGVANLEHSWIVSPNSPSIFDLKCNLQCSEGTVCIDTSHNRMIEKYTNAIGKNWNNIPYQDTTLDVFIHGRQLGFGTESIHHFVDCVCNDKQPLVGGEDGLRATEIIVAAEESVRTGQPVKVHRNQI
ncbi:MAG: Gfo/Idh/MocA family oxidoreductase [Chloroflexi bacterium]|jgi:predicted dehydrogenase|nr:Gfo/Idh/MocA family oxidoreductase [Anaerolineaceae bacterium]NMB87758.1 Gfo/Idh/MocA family oxidoreductase [Chloroflexota bacterium]